MRRLFSAAAILFVIFYVVTHPADAAHTAQAIGHGLAVAAESLSDFVAALAH